MAWCCASPASEDAALVAEVEAGLAALPAGDAPRSGRTAGAGAAHRGVSAGPGGRLSGAAGVDGGAPPLPPLSVRSLEGAPCHVSALAPDAMTEAERLWRRRAVVHAVVQRWDDARGWSQGARWRRLSGWRGPFERLFTFHEEALLNYAGAFSRARGQASASLDLVTFAEELFVPVESLRPEALAVDDRVRCQEFSKARALTEIIAAEGLGALPPARTLPGLRRLGGRGEPLALRGDDGGGIGPAAGVALRPPADAPGLARGRRAARAGLHVGRAAGGAHRPGVQEHGLHAEGNVGGYEHGVPHHHAGRHVARDAGAGAAHHPPLPAAPDARRAGAADRAHLGAGAARLLRLLLLHRQLRERAALPPQRRARGRPPGARRPGSSGCCPRRRWTRWRRRRWWQRTGASQPLLEHIPDDFESTEARAGARVCVTGGGSGEALHAPVARGPLAAAPAAPAPALPEPEVRRAAYAWMPDAVDEALRSASSRGRGRGPGRAARVCRLVGAGGAGRRWIAPKERRSRWSETRLLALRTRSPTADESVSDRQRLFEREDVLQRRAGGARPHEPAPGGARAEHPAAPRPPRRHASWSGPRPPRQPSSQPPTRRARCRTECWRAWIRWPSSRRISARRWRLEAVGARAPRCDPGRLADGGEGSAWTSRRRGARGRW